MPKPTKNAKNHMQLNIFTDQLDATRLAHALIGAGVEAFISPRWAVTVPQDQEAKARVAAMDFAEQLGRNLQNFQRER